MALVLENVWHVCYPQLMGWPITSCLSKFYILSYTVNLQASHIKGALYKGKKLTPSFPINRPVNILFLNKCQFDFLIWESRTKLHLDSAFDAAIWAIPN